ncbi:MULTISPECIES: hypothetical protein [unclassified Treponema]|uniref:hypothetical protein n=1 Tax=unclassified Treponema TaxID=2638727 RepID=UPI0025D01D43|nr:MULTISPECIES: hypothetical protein [unclassified Treponema]
MAEINSENSEIFGRKIFFICATFTLNTNIILRLMEQEYEIYKIDEPRQLKNLLELNPQSIVYFNVDTHFSSQVWFNFISSFEHNPKFEKCDFGVFSTKGTGKFLYGNALKLSAGAFTIDKNFGEIMGLLLQKLELLKAKGMRKFVRLICADNKSAEAYFISGNMMFKMNFIDISSIGVGLIVPMKYAGFIKINSVIQGLTLVLGNKQLKVNAKVHTIKAVSSGILAALIFTPDTPGNFRNYVRTYICEELQKKMAASLIKLQLDNTDYTIEVPAAVDGDKEQKKVEKTAEENNERSPAEEESEENKNQEPKTLKKTE